MKVLLLKNPKTTEKDPKLVELFGLSQSGKTTFLKKLIKKGHKDLSYEYSFFIKLYYFCKYLIRHPLKITYLLYKLNSNWIFMNHLKLKDYLKIFLMRNSYLGSVLAKCEILKQKKEKIIVDEFLLQSLLIILQKKSSREEIIDILTKFPSPDEILIIEISNKERYKRLNRIRFPGEQIDKRYAELWMKNSEFNYQIIKKILLTAYNTEKYNTKKFSIKS